MATLGYQPTFSGEANYGINTQPYQIGQAVGNFGGGTITQVNVYVGGWQAGVTVQLCLWDASGNILWNSGNITAPQGTTGIGGQGWITWNGSVNIAAVSGLIIGCWRDPAGRFAYSRDGNGSYYQGNNTSVGALSTFATPAGTLGAYMVYTPAPVISSASPNPVNVNQTLTISGSNFGGSTGTVTINGVSATVTSWGDTSIQVTVPILTTTGSYPVVVTTAAGFASSGYNVTVQVGGVKDYQSGAFTKFKLKSYQAGSFQWYALKQYTGSAWVRRA